MNYYWKIHQIFRFESLKIMHQLSTTERKCLAVTFAVEPYPEIVSWSALKAMI